MSHNIIVVHHQLIRFPDIAFFVSPIPLHIAAMVILYGHMSRCESLSRQVALEDVWMALDMLPSFRWRWERKDLNGGHPLIAKLAEKVLDVNLHQVGPASHPVLLSELDWENEVMGVTGGSRDGSGATQGSHGGHGGPSSGVHHTPPMSHAPYGGIGSTYGPGTPLNGNMGSAHGSPRSTRTLSTGGATPAPGDQKLAEVPPGLFYPFYPESNVVPPEQPNNGGPLSTRPGVRADGGAGAAAGATANGDYTQLLAAAAAQQTGGQWGASNQDSYMLEEKDVGVSGGVGVNMWMPDQRTMQGFAMGPPA